MMETGYWGLQSTGFTRQPQATNASGPSEGGFHVGRRLGWAFAIASFMSIGTGGVSHADNLIPNATGNHVVVVAARGGLRPQLATRATSSADGLREIKQSLSLNVTQLAQALRVSRPTLYSWLRDQSNPRSAQVTRLRKVSAIAHAWKKLTELPLGKYVNVPIEGERSLAKVLTSTALNQSYIEGLLAKLYAAMNAAERRRQVSGYRSVAKLAEQLGYEKVAPETQRANLLSESRRAGWKG